MSLTKDDLQAIAGLFAPIEARMEAGFTEISERLGKVEGRLDSVEQRLDRVEQRLDRVEQRLDRVEQRLDKLESDTAASESRSTVPEKGYQSSGTESPGYIRTCPGSLGEKYGKQSNDSGAVAAVNHTTIQRGQNRFGFVLFRGRKFFCVFKIGSSIQLELDM